MKRIFRIYRDWFFLFTYLSAIFVILPFSRYGIQSIVIRSPFYSGLVTFLVYSALLIIVMALVIYVIVADKRFKIPRLILLALILFIGLHGLRAIKGTSDKVHVIEYTLLTFFLFRILRFYNPTTALYFWCAIFVGIAGFVDESIQSLFPARIFSLRDLRTDMFAGILTAFSIALVICPRLEKWRIKMTFFRKELDRQQEWIKDYRMRRGEDNQ